LGSEPNVLPPARTDLNFMNKALKTDDIHGCHVGTKGAHNFHTRERRDIRNPNTNDDIIGSKCGSLRRAPDTKRELHPLDPVYQFPGRSELTNINDCFGKKNPV